MVARFFACDQRSMLNGLEKQSVLNKEQSNSPKVQPLRTPMSHPGASTREARGSSSSRKLA
jgi:hypothetical protein